MCASVAEVLKKEFGKKLGDNGVHIIDPCTAPATSSSTSSAAFPRHGSNTCTGTSCTATK